METEIKTAETTEPPQPLMTLYETQGIFVDALLTDQADNLVFTSLWGRDTSIRELQSRITLGKADGGLTTFNVVEKLTRSQAELQNRKYLKHFVRIGDADALEQYTGRVRTDILGEMIHVFLFQRDILKPDLANYRATLIGPDISLERNGLTVWSLIRSICPVPLLDHWADGLLPFLSTSGMIQSLSGINQSGLQIALDEERVALFVKQACQDGKLTLAT